MIFNCYRVLGFGVRGSVRGKNSAFDKANTQRGKLKLLF